MATRTLTKEKSIKERFFNDIISAVSTPAIENEDGKDEIWEFPPPSLTEFCNVWINEPLFPGKQQEFGDAMCGTDPFIFDTTYDEGHAFWGKGSGKDRTIAKLKAYVIAKLICLRNPQKFLRENYGASIADGDNIDIANMSINARQAENVYFKKFKSILKKTINPNTGRNWFEEMGVDMREGYDLQTVEVSFPKNITAHSLNSETNTGEGLSPIFVTIDEFGSFKADNAFGLLESVRESVISRFPGVGKVAVISYKYYHNDPMDVLFRKEVNEPRTFSSKGSTFEVNQFRTKNDFAKAYRTNPERAKMIYECEGGETEGGFVTLKYMINYMFDPKYANPYPRDIYSIESDLLLTTPLAPDFKGKDGVLYCCHADLASGKEFNDCVGFALGHVERMYAKLDPKMKKDLAKQGIYVDMVEDADEITRKGVVIDLALQIKAKTGGEVRLSDIRNFIKLLKNKYGFNIVYGTFDGWESRDSIQQLNESGIDSWVESVDRKPDAYTTWKELMYQQLVKCHPQPIAEREARELIVDDKGKIDHPEMSYERDLKEGRDDGSKDVMDAIAAVTKVAYEKMNIEPDIFFG